jgi:hypothetical protein
MCVAAVYSYVESSCSRNGLNIISWQNKTAFEISNTQSRANYWRELSTGYSLTYYPPVQGLFKNIESPTILFAP